MFVLFFNDSATTEIYTYCHTLSLHDALPISSVRQTDTLVRWDRFETGASGPNAGRTARASGRSFRGRAAGLNRSEEHTSELQSLMRISYAVFCLKKKKDNGRNDNSELSIRATSGQRESESQ